MRAAPRQKEWWRHVLADNLIRAVIVRAALRQVLCLRQLSFKGALQAVNPFTPALVLAEGAVVAALLDALLGAVAAQRWKTDGRSIGPIRASTSTGGRVERACTAEGTPASDLEKSGMVHGIRNRAA